LFVFPTQAPFIPGERAHVNGVHDFEEQFNDTQKERPTLTAAQQKHFQNFDYVNPHAYEVGYFRIPRATQAP
jgi:hypothetical protein